jgi:two-component system sensor kinase FixL
MSRDTVKLLRRTPIFSFLDPNSLTKISELFREETYTSGHVFFRDDAVNDILYIIKQGAVKIVKTGKSGEGKLSFILRREGDFFGETALIEETSPLETAQAIKNTKVLQLSRSDFLTIVSSYPFVAFQIMKALTSRLRQSYLGLIEELGEKDEQLEKACVEPKFSTDVEGKGIQPKEEGISFSDEVISAFPFSIVATRKDGTIFIFNQSAEKEYGYSSEEALGKGINLLRGEPNLLNFDQLIKRSLEDKGVWRGEIIAKRKNGERFVSETAVHKIAGPKSTGTAILWVGRDITPERGLAREASEKDRWFNIAEKIREVVLEFSDLAQILSENLDLLTRKAKMSDFSQSETGIKAMKDALDDLKGIILRFTSYPPPESDKEPTDPANFIEKELLFLRRQKRFEGIEFITKYDRNLPLIDIDQHQMRRLLTDLLDNATFALRSVSDREKTITIEVRYLAKDEEIEIQILDTGIGISEDDLPKIFKEHFTTKDKGFGLGLFSVKRAVESYGGTIEVQSVEGAYTLFTIRFPAKKQASIQEEKTSLEMISSLRH